MTEENSLRRIFSVIIFLGLLALSYLVLKPILLSVVFGLILAFIFSPIYKFFLKITKAPNLSAGIICLILLSIIIIPIWFFTPTVINQTLKLYQSAQETDFITPLKNLFPSFFASDEFSREFGSTIQSFITKSSNSVLNMLGNFLLNFPTLLLQFTVVLFTLFFALRDSKQMIEYLESLMPFPKHIQAEFFNSSRDITASILYGTVIIGLIQGVIVGIGFFAFKVPSAFLLTILAVIAGVLPIIGTGIIWLPVTIYFLIVGNNLAAFGILLFGILSSNIDNVLRPLFVSKRTKLHSSVVLIGMIGGVFVFGALGFLLGPLILAYLLIVLELYREVKS
ncbi:AI-2E family transporter [Candidatus Pacearchaeota archaeon]|nr:AI-2E family transporter [Candidatus Pacearchaeota archaeon]